jgi:RNA polymerase sigma factor (sigma-70 family)
MATVCAASRTRKRNQRPTCPTCGTQLVTTHDTDTLTELVCEQCSRPNVSAWLSTEAGYERVQQLARQFKGLARCDVDELASEIAVSLLECGKFATSGDGFDGWVAEIARLTAARLWRDSRDKTTSVDPEIMKETVTEEFDDSEPPFENCSELVKHERNLRRRVQYQLAKLSAPRRAAITARYFLGLNLSEVARSQGQEDSTARQALLRGKRELESLMDRHGYAASRKKPTGG